MPVFQELIDFNEMISKLKESPVIVNDLMNVGKEEKELIRNMILSKYSSDMMSILPSCQCGEMTGEYSIGVICPTCNTPVRPILNDDIEPLIWFRRPVGVAPLINPMVWIMLTKRFTRSGFSIMQWICDTTYRPGVKQPPILDKIIASGIQRGYNNFFNNFDAYIEILFNTSGFTVRKNQIDYLYRLIKENRHKIFSDYLPLPNKIFLIIEKTEVGMYVDPIVTKATDAILMITSIDSSIMEHNVRVKENRTIKAISMLGEFYSNFFRSILSGKPGQFRKHIYGTRTNFNFRAVISSITDKHTYDEIYVPWSVGVTAFRPHILNKLLKMGYDLNSGIGLLLGSVEKYHPMLDSILRDLISESPNKGIVVLEQRNPTMLSGSAQVKYITKFKTDVTDHTVSTSILTTKSMNADYDGDALNYSISLDSELAGMWLNLEPHNNVFVAQEPKKISGNIAMPKPVIATISNWLSVIDVEDPEKLKIMANI